MSEDPTKTGGAGDPNPSGKTDGNPPEPKNDLEKVLAKNQELLEENKKAKRRLDALEKEQKDRDEKALKDKEDWKSLAEQRAADLEAANQKLSAKESQERDRTKLVAVLEAVGGTVERKYWGLIDLEKVVINPDTGEIDKTSVAKYADVFKKEHPALITVKKGDGFVKDAPQGGLKDPTYEEWKNMPAKEMRKHLPAIMKR